MLYKDVRAAMHLLTLEFSLPKSLIFTYPFRIKYNSKFKPLSTIDINTSDLYDPIELFLPVHICTWMSKFLKV